MSTKRNDVLDWIARIAEYPDALDDITPVGLELVIATLLSSLGFRVSLGRIGGGASGNLVVSTGVREATGIVECKLVGRGRAVGSVPVADTMNAMKRGGATFAYVVTTGTFSRDARNLVTEAPGSLRLIDRDNLVAMARQARASGKAESALQLLGSQELLIQASLVSDRGSTADGVLVEAVAVPWLAIIREIEHDPAFLFRIPWRKLEELIAAAYEREGWPEVVLTPRSDDKGRDIIASKPGFGAVRIFDQVKAFAPHRSVDATEVRALLGVLTAQGNVSKGVVTTTTTFAPGIVKEISHLMPYRLELKDGIKLREWLRGIAEKRHEPDIAGSRILRDR